MSDTTPTEALKRWFGFESLRPGQAAIIEDVLAGRPTLAIMPTGAGKSLCYQLPAMMSSGVTLVVSPLIALMKDQVDALRARGIDAAFVNSSQSSAEQHDTLRRVADGHTKLLYVAPERFGHAAFREAMARSTVAMVAIDEAHCISRWGHDFRPDYQRLGEALKWLKPPRVLACTATATGEVRDDIVRSLGLETPAVHVRGFLRENLHLEVRFCDGERDREAAMLELLERDDVRSGAAILYASTRKRVDRTAAALSKRFPGQVAKYHAGMSGEDRDEAQRRFVAGDARIVVATNAFGMGVDRGDVRAVVHTAMPGTVEGYYQEVGRAGRDGDASTCVLLYNATDSRVHEFLIEMSYPPLARVTATWETLRGMKSEWHHAPADVADRLGESSAYIEAAFRVLNRAGAVELDPDGQARPRPEAPDDVLDMDIDFKGMAERRRIEDGKLTWMRRFVHHGSCRHRFLLDYFGEALDVDCPGCDRCHGSTAPSRFDLPDRDATVDEVTIVRKALAGVARSQGRFGLNSVAAMLAGSRSKRILDSWLSKLSTYGLLTDLGNAGCQRLLQLLREQGLCAIEGGEYPLIVLTEQGAAVMRGDVGPEFALPRDLRTAAAQPGRARGAASGVEVSPADASLAAALRAWRADRARSEGVPAYRLFTNRTLEALCAQRPTDEASFLTVRGLGPGSWSAFGADLLAVIRDAG